MDKLIKLDNTTYLPGMDFVFQKEKIDSSYEETIVGKYSVYELWVMGESNPFYVGKGMNGRPYVHLYLAKNKDKTLKSNKIRKAWENNLPIIIKHVFRTDINEEAIEEEKRLIALYGRRDKGTGVLVNFTDGGEGQSSPSEETRRKMSEARKNYLWTEESRKKLSNSKTGIKLSEEHCQKISEARKNYLWTEESRRKLSNSKTGIKLSEEHCQKISDGQKGKILSEETKQKIRAGNKGKTISEETRQKLSIINKGKTISEETRQKLSIRSKGNKYAVGSKGRLGQPISEEHRRKLSESLTGRVVSEETRQKIRISSKKVHAIRRQTLKNLATLNEILSREES